MATQLYKPFPALARGAARRRSTWQRNCPGRQRESHLMHNSPEIAEQIRSIVLDVLHDSDGTTAEADLELDTDLRGYLGFDSLSIMYVLSTAEERFGVTLGDAELMTSTMSVRALASYIGATQAR